MTKSNAERYAEFEQRLADMKAADAAWVQFLDVLTGKLPAGSRLWVSDPDDDGLVEVCEDDGTLADGIRRGLREEGGAMTIYRETMTAYRKRPALSAGFLWDIVSECPAYAWAHADMNPERLERSRADHLEFGEIAHLAVLENEPLAERISVIDAKDWRTQMARDLRDQAYIDDKIPVLYKDLLRVQAVRKALEASHAAPLLFGDGESELTYTWYEPDRPGETFLRQECKARIDRYTGSTLVHLKTAASPAPDSFAKACANFGYDLAAAWYLDGWIEQTMDHKWDDYCFVVVGSKPPHLVGVYQLSGDDLEEGRALYQMALQECRRAVETGVWRGYGYNDGSPMIINMPAWRQRQAFEEEGVRRG